MTVTVSAQPVSWAADPRTPAGTRAPAGPLRRATLAGSRSRILAATEGRVWLFGLLGARGWFSKDDERSLRRGRELCDRIQERYSCPGFLTTDELPRYGLGRRDRAALFDAYPAADPSRDVLVVLAYDDPHLVMKIRADIVSAVAAELGSAPVG